MSAAEVIRQHLLAHGKNPKAASEAEILRVLKRWADARGFGAVRTDAEREERVRLQKPWVVVDVESRRALIQWRAGRLTMHVPPAIALAWALLVESEPPPADVGPCPECKGDGLIADCESSAQMLESLGCADGWHVSDCFTDPCPACTGTGRKLAPVPRLLLDATTDAARTELLVLADRLQAAGDPLGELLGWALGLWTGEPTEPAVERRDLPVGSSTAAMFEVEAEGYRCDWSLDSDGWPYVRPVLGHPHTAAAAGALEATLSRV